MRNKPVDLTAADKARASKARKVLDAARPDERVLINYVRRDGVEKHYDGTVVERLGKDSHEAVVLDTIKGARTLNLWRVKSVSLY